MKTFIPKLEQFYFYFSDWGNIVSSRYLNDKIDQYRIQTGNCFPTLEAAEYHRRMQTKAWEIRQKSFESEWVDSGQEKYYVYFDHAYNEITFSSCWCNQYTRIIFISEEIARAAFADVSNDDFLYMQSRGLV